MASITDLLSVIVGDAFAAAGLGREFGAVVPSVRPDLSQFQCNGAFPAARVARRNPKQIAADVAATLAAHDVFQDVSVAGNGFLNLTVTPAYLAARAADIVGDARVGIAPVDAPLDVVIDFGGPNVAKAMHVGHLRSSIIGDALQRLFAFAGHRVTSDVHLGDWGTQMGMLIVEMSRRAPELPYFDRAFGGPWPETAPVTLADLGEMYPAAAARSKADPVEMEAARAATAELQAGLPAYRALWQHFVDVSRAALEHDFATLGVRFDLWLGESSVQDRIPAMIDALRASGVAVVSEGMLVIPVPPAAGGGEVPPLILLKSDGAVMYGTTDLATVDQRVRDLHADLILYVVDKRQALHFHQVFEAARLSGIAGGAALEHIAFGTVNGPDGKPFKTRAGGVLALQDLLAMAVDRATQRIEEAHLAADASPEERARIAMQVGVGAVRFADLQHERTTDYVFDLDKFTSFEGYTGPYLQYQAVRCQSVLRKAAEQGLADGPIVPAHAAEIELVLQLLQLPDAIRAAVETRAPHHLCSGAYEIAKRFARFYHACPILSDDDAAVRASRLAVTRLTLRALDVMLSLLGIEIPERM